MRRLDKKRPISEQLRLPALTRTTEILLLFILTSSVIRFEQITSAALGRSRFYISSMLAQSLEIRQVRVICYENSSKVRESILQIGYKEALSIIEDKRAFRAI
jgi:hypothetical protein